MSTSTDILAKLLATENITVIRAKAHTASFDVKQRVLTLPNWEFKEANVEEMLVLHEVGHALFTTIQGYISIVEKEKHLAHYMNVVEDVRIEKKMKERYPGSNKTFYLGYKELNEKDFFEIKGKSQRFFDDLKLIDKVNLYYKVGADCGISLDEDEKRIVDLVAKCVTEEDVAKVSRIIYEMDLNKDSKPIRNMDSFSFDDSGNAQSDGDLDIDLEEIDDTEEYDESDDSDYENKKGSSSSGGNKEMKSVTQDSFNRNLKVIESANNAEVFYYLPKFAIEKATPIIVGYKEIFSCIDRETLPGQVIKVQKITSTTNKIVSNLLKEFEMKKSAQSLKYSTVSKTGQLSASKLFSYKVKDDIFKKITRMKDSKRHGMVFLLDWSGSMQRHISSTLDQILNLALFCKRGGIPFQVLAFSDYFSSSERLYQNRTINPNGLGDGSNFALLEFFSDKMTIPEIEKMYSYTQNYRLLTRRFHMGSTPLNEALIFMVDYLKEFIQKNNVEKMSFITFTDGEANKVFGYNPTPYRKNFLRDPETRREYRIKYYGMLTEILLKVIKHRYPMIDTAGFYITQLTGSFNGGVYSFCSHHYDGDRNLIVSKSEKIKESMKANGFSIEKNLAGRDKYYILNSRKLVVEDAELEDIEEGVSSRAIAREFSKSVESGKNSRIILNKFIEQIA